MMKPWQVNFMQRIDRRWREFANEGISLKLLNQAVALAEDMVKCGDIHRCNGSRKAAEKLAARMLMF